MDVPLEVNSSGIVRVHDCGTFQDATDTVTGTWCAKNSSFGTVLQMNGCRRRRRRRTLISCYLNASKLRATSAKTIDAH